MSNGLYKFNVPNVNANNGWTRKQFNVVNAVIVQTHLPATAVVCLQLLYIGNGHKGKHRVGERNLEHEPKQYIP